MRVLAIDTAAPVHGVGLLVDGRREVAVATLARGSETWLVPTAIALATQLGVRLADLDGVVVAAGPGAFTGLRVGLATALGVAIAAGIPVVAVPSLRHRGLAVEGGPVLAMLDARKERVYAAFTGGPDGDIDPADVPPDVAIGWVRGPFIATGEGAVRYADLIRAAGGVLFGRAADPAVDVLLSLGEDALRRGEGVDPTTVRPLYLRDADASLPAASGGVPAKLEK